MKRNALSGVLLVLVWGCATPQRESEIVLPAADLEGIQLVARSAEELGIESAEELARLLEYRWSVSRIQAFTESQPEIRHLGRSGVSLSDTGWTREMHVAQGTFSGIYLRTYGSGGKQQYFLVAADKGDKRWVLEAGRLEDLFNYRIVHLGERQTYEWPIPAE